MSSQINPLCEPLENRRLLSGNPLIMLPVGGVYGVTVGVNASTSPGTTQHGKSNAATVTTTSLLGTWQGKVKVNLFIFVSKRYGATFSITKQTATSITGSVTVKGKTFSGTFNGSINPDGSFSYKLTKGKSSIKVSGDISADGKSIQGKIKANYDGWGVSGTFDFKRTA